jgi:hypothetical protein
MRGGGGGSSGSGSGSGSGAAAAAGASLMNGGAVSGASLMTGGPSMTNSHLYASAPRSQFGMSANAPSFNPTGGASYAGGGGGRPPGGAMGAGGLGARSASFSLEEASMREAAENLWGGLTSGGGAGAPGTSAPAGAARFTVPSSMDRVPSLSAMEAQSMRAAAAGLWGASTAPAPAPAPSIHVGQGMPPLPSALLGGNLGGNLGGYDGLRSSGGVLGGSLGNDPLGHCDHLLAGLALDGGSEPSGHR